HDDHDDHDDHAGHDHSGVDPHFFTDPIQMIEVVEGLTEFLIEKISDIDADLVRSNAESYIGELEELHSEISALFSEIPTSKRVLVTNHQVFGYFAEQYGFEVVGTVIPSSSTLDSASAKGLTELIDVIKKYEVTAIFADVASSNVLASTLADEVGDIQVIDLYSESLGEQGSGASTYLGMIRSNAKLISEGLTDHDHDH
ncbi:MAG TPA: zinc ABC transporter substrate-binding protein, partial [Acidimicrobiaceae bacterium]|nr:zinc ABC transporter substrate-binding protein [Acidimicrobiaceae bacterium]